VNNMRKNQITQSMGWPFTIIYIALIITALYFTFVTAPMAINANNWPQTQGKVTQAELAQRKRITKTSDIISVFSAKIHFEYTINGHQYIGHELRWSDRNSENIEALMVAQYPAGANVTVFYNPEKPNIAVLQKGLSFGHILTGIFLLVSICAMAYSIYRNTSNRRIH
jgi:hypothetical protein